MERLTVCQRWPSQVASPTSCHSHTRADVIVIFLFVVVQAIAYIIPPFQSPDEEAHIARAYLLSKGDIFLRANGGQTGGEIDTGLLAYMDSFGELMSQYDVKVSASGLRSSQQITWSGHRRFGGLFNTAVYLPLPYFPQACALFLGEHAGLTVENTYHLARLFSLVATLLLLRAALLLYPTPLIVIALFATPMTLFQLGSASLDAVTFGMTTLAASLFLRGSDLRFPFSRWMHLTLALCVLSLSTSRINLFTMTLLPAVIYFFRRSRQYLISSAISLGLATAWIMYAMLSVQGMPPRELSTLQIAMHYLTHPGALCDILFDTLSNYPITRSYWVMFVGVLGWLDTPLDSYVYSLFPVMLIALAALSVQRRAAQLLHYGNLALLTVAALSFLFIFLIERLTFTPYPPKVIDGIQGRYFTPIFILLGYSMFGRRLSNGESKLGDYILVLIVASSVVSMVPKLVHRFWMS